MAKQKSMKAAGKFIKEDILETEKRRKREAKEAQRVQKILMQHDNEAELLAELTAQGYDLKALQKKAAASEMRLKQLHRDLLKGATGKSADSKAKKAREKARETPAGKPGITEKSGFVFFYRPTPHSTWESTDCGTNEQLREFNIRATKQGRGLGYGWVAVDRAPAEECYFYFVYHPPFPGDLFVEARFTTRGTVAISSDDRLWNSSRASFDLTAYMDLGQDYWDGVTRVDLINANRRNGSWLHNLDVSQSLQKSMSVSDQDAVIIKFGLRFDAFARSSSARVDADFRTGASQKIVIDYFRMRMTR